MFGSRGRGAAPARQDGCAAIPLSTGEVVGIAVGSAAGAPPMMGRVYKCGCVGVRGIGGVLGLSAPPTCQLTGLLQTPDWSVGGGGDKRGEGGEGGGGGWGLQFFFYPGGVQ